MPGFDGTGPGGMGPMTGGGRGMCNAQGPMYAGGVPYGGGPNYGYGAYGWPRRGMGMGPCGMGMAWGRGGAGRGVGRGMGGGPWGGFAPDRQQRMAFLRQQTEMVAEQLRMLNDEIVALESEEE